LINLTAEDRFELEALVRDDGRLEIKFPWQYRRMKLVLTTKHASEIVKLLTRLRLKSPDNSPFDAYPMN
jgi:hypothetical protein